MCSSDLNQFGRISLQDELMQKISNFLDNSCQYNEIYELQAIRSLAEVAKQYLVKAKTALEESGEVQSELERDGDVGIALDFMEHARAHWRLSQEIWAQKRL